MAPELRTDRLLLRHWTDADLAPYAALNADPAVMEYFPEPLTRAQSDASANAIRTFLSLHDFGLWAVQAPELGFIGFVGLSIPSWEAAFTPCVEIGWRLARVAWGHGYATEAARACLDYGFSTVGVSEVLSFTAVQNQRSRAVMERIGMTHDAAGDFNHPRLPGHPLERHVLYRISTEQWQARTDDS